MKKDIKIVYFGKGQRSIICFLALINAGYKIDLVVGQDNEKVTDESLLGLAQARGIETIAPKDPNSPEIEELLRQREADLFILGGYGKIIKQNIIDLPKSMCINLHGGALPKYRGSSPLNWALINNEKTFAVSIIQVDSGVDTGPILGDKIAPIEPEDDIKSLHEKANAMFSELLLETVEKISSGSVILRCQNKNEGSYYPLRFPGDGFIVFDMDTAEKIHGKIRALTDPYPGAFCYLGGIKVKLLKSELSKIDFFGEPGRVYRKTKKGILVCAADKCLWITKAEFEDNGQSLFEIISRYDKLTTAREIVRLHAEQGEELLLGKGKR